MGGYELWRDIIMFKIKKIQFRSGKKESHGEAPEKI